MKTSLTWLGRLIDSPGDADWQRLTEVYRPLISRWAASAGVAVSDVDDVSQEVLIVVARRVREFEYQQPGAFRSWLRSILSFQLKKYFREHSDKACLLPLDRIAVEGSSESELFDREHDEFLVGHAMKTIRSEFSAQTWTAFEQQVLHGNAAIDVASQLEMTRNAVVKAKARVLCRLREFLRGPDQARKVQTG